jgi:flagellar hook assembly protein FlgD
VAGARLLAGLPNPFTASTSIRYELPAATPARLEVFDTQGRRVRLLVEDQLQGPGSFKVTWDGRNDASQIVAPGVYVYRLRAGAFDDTRKILRLR